MVLKIGEETKKRNHLNKRIGKEENVTIFSLQIRNQCKQNIVGNLCNLLCDEINQEGHSSFYEHYNQEPSISEKL